MSKYNFNRPEANTPEYKAWRNAVFRRDNYACIMCGLSRNIQAHHIKRFADYPELRYVVSNGATICRDHHLQVTGREQQYEAEFNRLVAAKRARYGKKFKGPKIKWKPRNPNNRFGY